MGTHDAGCLLVARPEGLEWSQLKVAVCRKIEEVNSEVSRKLGVLIFIAGSFTCAIQVAGITENPINMVCADMPDAQIWIAAIVDSQAAMNVDE